ncbi:hypothetical protein SAMN04488137_1012 [Fictibacillus solisalsi]|uniref:Uncharacterized protein n=1 Tax=Fictibacillus solisalsi TaxID=459525 RepID=A0A1G9UMA5_9BACL|nr:hypothetical protein [Fictibacillus solisalsi]SDM61028.1 hypothetical protein SAMN04488137_1012 [Fictibacillus solisalsi]
MDKLTIDEEIEIAKGNLKGLYNYGDCGERTLFWLERLEMLKKLQKDTQKAS